MSIYCVTPIERMNKGLGDWLSFRVPFAVKGDLKDEVLELKEKIESLINISNRPNPDAAMRVDVVLRYIGVVMLFIAMFMLLSAGISYLSGMDSAFYPLLLSLSLLTALLGAFP